MQDFHSGPLLVCKRIFTYDEFVFPWLKYRVDGPSGGRDFLIQVIYQPDKFWHLTSFYKNEEKAINQETLNERTNALVHL